MDGQFDIRDVLAAPPGWRRLVARGLLRRCPRCGGRGVFSTRWRLRDRCPTCGYRFRREPGFFMGAWFINFMVLEIVHWAMAMAFIVWRSSHPGGALVWPMLALALTGVALPIWLYPHSQTVWAGIDLAMAPLELSEIVDAVDAADAADRDGAFPDPPASDQDPPVPHRKAGTEDGP